MLLPALLQPQLRGQSSFLGEKQKLPHSPFPRSEIRGTQLTGPQSSTHQSWEDRTGSLLWGAQS